MAISSARQLYCTGDTYPIVNELAICLYYNNMCYYNVERRAENPCRQQQMQFSKADIFFGHITLFIYSHLVCALSNRLTAARIISLSHCVTFLAKNASHCIKLALNNQASWSFLQISKCSWECLAFFLSKRTFAAADFKWQFHGNLFPKAIKYPASASYCRKNLTLYLSALWVASIVHSRMTFLLKEQFIFSCWYLPSQATFIPKNFVKTPIKRKNSINNFSQLCSLYAVCILSTKRKENTGHENEKKQMVFRFNVMNQSHFI